MMGAMSGLVAALQGRRVFAEFPAGLSADWIPACEVLLQEGVRAWALHHADLGLLEQALRLFGRRARIGVRGATTAAQVADAVAFGAHFVTSPVAAPELIAAAGGVPMALGALTPNEIHYALGLGAPAVQVLPADVVGIGSAVAMGAFFPDAEVVPVGRFVAIEADQGLDAGAPAIGLTPASLFPSGRVGDLDHLRLRCRPFGALR